MNPPPLPPLTVKAPTEATARAEATRAGATTGAGEGGQVLVLLIGLVVLRADGTLPSFVPGVPGLPVHMTAQMHEEESL